MQVTIVYVSVKEKNIDDFIQASAKNHSASILEDGNFRFDFVQQADDPTKFVLYEAYRSDGDASKHKESAHYKEWRETVAEMMAEPRKATKYNYIKPDTFSK